MAFNENKCMESCVFTVETTLEDADDGGTCNMNMVHYQIIFLLYFSKWQKLQQDKGKNTQKGDKPVIPLI